MNTKENTQNNNIKINLSECRLIVPESAIISTGNISAPPCQISGNKVLYIQNLDNCILSQNFGHDEQGEKDMSKYKIQRTVVISGKRCQITANTEQEYAEKLMAAFNQNSAKATAEVHDEPERQEDSQKPSKHLFRDYANHWYDVYVAPNVSTASCKSYRSQLNAHILPVIGDMYVEDITVADLQEIFNKMGTECTKSSKDKARIPLRQIFNCAVEDGLIHTNPAVSTRLKIKGQNSKETKAYTVDEMRFLAANIDKINSATDRAWLALTMFHPLRPEEVLGLKYKDIDRDNMLIHVCRAVTHPGRNMPEIKDTKTAGSHRTLGLVAKALEYIPEGDPEDFIIGGKQPVSYTVVRRICKRVKTETGFNCPVMPRRFRCTVLTDIYDSTKDVKQVQQAAGHTTAAMTLKYYVKGRAVSEESARVIGNLYNTTV